MTAFALKLDAVVTGANGAAYLVAADPIGDLLGLSPSLLRGIGAFLLAFAAVVWMAATRRAADALAVTGIAAANVVWALGSAAAAVAGWGTPTTEGTVWMVLQALVVAGFAELQLVGLRREPAVPAR
jgi:hypothetical protein